MTRRQAMRGREVIVVTVLGADAYVRARRTADGQWYTRDVNEAKVYRHPGFAAGVVRGSGWARDGLDPRVIDPRTVAGYKDKPTEAGRRAADREETFSRAMSRATRERR